MIFLSEAPIVIQIGSFIGNVGNDPIYKNMDTIKPSMMVLVEPVPRFFERLKLSYQKYLHLCNIVFINKAVSDKVGTIELTVPAHSDEYGKRFPYWAEQLASCNSDHISKHGFDDLPTEKLIVETTTVDQIVLENNLSKIDLLHLDTEGHDYEILNSYSFSVKPSFIVFEHKHIKSRVGNLMEKLKNNGYKMFYVTDDDVYMKLGE